MSADHDGADRTSRHARTLKRAGLAATILLAPGGFILGSALVWRYYRSRRANSDAAEPKAD